ncbi:MAG TPA: flavodoxin domain-containing protein [Prolixibacteraceae bacterium]|nr:flavodoxin [Bacteroidales bacterium]HQN94251.1 flavodoxin domain-containing protein [Prolixibacteraceae bacterium]
MNTAIIYATKHGTTEKVAEIIKNKLTNGNTTLINITENESVEIKKFDRIIIGSSIYGGFIHKDIKLFIENNMIELLQKEVGLFTCGMFFEKAYENIDKNFPEILRVHAKSKHPMGGEFLFEKMNFIERFLVKKISGAKKSVSKIDEKCIEEFISEINNN